MKRVIILERSNNIEMTDRVNDFLEQSGVKLVDIKFLRDGYGYSVMVIYEEIYN